VNTTTLNNKIILGTVQFGLPYGVSNIDKTMPSKDDVFEILDFAHKKGINELDTAIGYGCSWERIDEFCSTRNINFTIMSKFKDQDFEETTQLQTPISGWYFHSYEEFEESFNAQKITDLKSNNDITTLGVSLYTTEQFEKANKSADIDIIQIPFNLLDNLSNKESQIKEAQRSGKKIYVRSVFLQGLFFMEPDKIPTHLTELKEPLMKLRRISEDNNIPISALALLYPLTIQGIDKIIIGVESKSQLLDNLEIISKYHLTDKIVEEINSIKIANKDLLNPALWPKK